MSNKLIKTLFIGLFLIFVLHLFGCNEKEPPNSPEETTPPKYDFETDKMGWEPQDHPNSLAITNVEQTSEKAYSGSKGSLKLMVNLIGSDTSYGQGEAFVDLRYHPPEDVTAPVNLLGREITAQIFAEEGARGPKDHENFFQIFVKDSNWKSEYGPAKDVIENIWFKIKLMPSMTEPLGGQMDPGFDPTGIVMVGVKIGSRADSTYRYAGPMYMDAFNW